MAERRMFAKTIVLSDAFLDMPMGARCLYMTLGMIADDDGFVNSPKSVMRQCGSSEDDFRILIAKNFIIPFENGIIVIKHWRINNYLQKDRMNPTKYTEEKALLAIENNGAYKRTDSDPRVYTEESTCVYTEQGSCVSIDKDRIDKDSIGKVNNISTDVDISPSCQSDNSVKSTLDGILRKWNTLVAYGIKPIRAIVPESQRHELLRARLRQYGEDSFDEVIERIKASDFLQGKSGGSRTFVATFDWVIRPNNYPKVLEGNYDNRQQNSNLHGSELFMAIARGET